MENIDKINEFVDKQARNLVGVLCKRVELLSEEEQLKPSLYKKLVKELVYENSRALKEVIRVYFIVGKVIFKSKNESN